MVFHTGTMGPEPENGHCVPQSGALYSLSKGELKQHVQQIGISNGLAWNLALKKFYYIDSFAFSVDEFDYDLVTGDICKFYH